MEHTIQKNILIFKYKVYFLSIYDKISKGQIVTKWIASCQEALMVVHLGIIHQGY